MTGIVAVQSVFFVFVYFEWFDFLGEYADVLLLVSMGLINLLAYNYGRYAYFKTVEGACYESLTRPQCESKEWRITMETLLIVLVVYYFIDRWWRDRAMKKMINEGVKLFEILADATDRIEQQLGTAELGLIHNEKKYGIDYSLDAEKYTSEYTSPILKNIEVLLASQADIYKEVLLFKNFFDRGRNNI